MNLTIEFQAAINILKQHVERFGFNHPNTNRAMLLAMQLAPEEFIDEIANMASDMGLMPETKCYLEDGTPLIKLDDLAAQLGVPFTEAKISLQELLTERENLGFSNAGLIADPTKIHWKQ